MQGFRPVGRIDSADTVSTYWVPGNSERVYTGGWIKPGSAGRVDEFDSAGETTLIGSVVGIYGYDGTNKYPLSAITTADYGHTVNADTPAAQDVTVSATNESRANQIIVLVTWGNGVIWSGRLDAAAATTTGSNVAGYYITAVTTAGSTYLLDESTASATITNTCWVLVPGGRDPDDATDPEANDSRRVLCVLIRQAALLG